MSSLLGGAMGEAVGRVAGVAARGVVGGVAAGVGGMMSMWAGVESVCGGGRGRGAGGGGAVGWCARQATPLGGGLGVIAVVVYGMRWSQQGWRGAVGGGVVVLFGMQLLSPRFFPPKLH